MRNDFFIMGFSVFITALIINYTGIKPIEERLTHLESVTFGSSRCLK